MRISRGVSDATADKWGSIGYGGALIAGAPGSGMAVRGFGSSGATGGAAGLNVTSTIEGGVAEIVGNGAKGQIRIMGNMSREGNVITLDATHIEGAGPGTSSPSEMRGVVQQFGRDQGASQVIINGAARTTGRHAGQVPRPITVNIPQ